MSALAQFTDRLQSSTITPLALFRRVSAVCLVLLALLVWFGLALDQAAPADRSSAIEAALSENELNEAHSGTDPDSVRQGSRGDRRTDMDHGVTSCDDEAAQPSSGAP